MKQSGRHEIHAPRARVWAALNDTQILKQCIEGCESFEQVEKHSFSANVRLHIGPVNALLCTNIRLQSQPDTDPGVQHFLLQVEVERAEAGFGKGEARVTLEEKGTNLTLLNYDLKASVGGKIAQLGSRLVEAAATSMADSFFTKLEQVVGTPSAPLLNPIERAGPRRKLRQALAGAAVGAGLVALVVVFFS